MPLEPTGPGYVAPPIPPGTSVPQEERVRSVEDFLSRRVKSRLYRTSSQSLSQGVRTAVEWQAETFDTANMWESGSGITIPEGAQGDYLIICQINMNPTSDGAYLGTDLEIAINSTVWAAARAGEYISSVIDHTLLAGDVVRAYVTNGVAGVSKPQSIKSGSNNTYISLRRLV